MRRTANPSPGFTLVELMIAVLVLAVIATFAVTPLRDFFDRGKVRGAADDLVSTISQTRAEAVKHGIDARLHFTADAGDWCAGAQSPDAPSGGAAAGNPVECNCLTDAPACTIAGQTYKVMSDDHPDVAIGALPTSMIFDSNLGVLVPLGARQVTLTSPTGKYDVRVQINALGQAHACTPPTKPTMSSLPSC